jgi:hypothetical protein
VPPGFTDGRPVQAAPPTGAVAPGDLPLALAN